MTATDIIDALTVTELLVRRGPACLRLAPVCSARFLRAALAGLGTAARAGVLALCDPVLLRDVHCTPAPPSEHDTTPCRSPAVLVSYKISRGTSGAHRDEICHEPLRTGEISATRSEIEFVHLLWSGTCQHETRPIGPVAALR
jgi:hypothetical protein